MRLTTVHCWKRKQNDLAAFVERALLLKAAAGSKHFGLSCNADVLLLLCVLLKIQNQPTRFRVLKTVNIYTSQKHQVKMSFLETLQFNHGIK